MCFIKSLSIIILYWYVIESNIHRFQPSTFFPLQNSGSQMFLIPTISEVSQDPEALVVIWLLLDQVAIAPFSMALLFMRLPLLPTSSNITKGLSAA